MMQITWGCIVMRNFFIALASFAVILVSSPVSAEITAREFFTQYNQVSAENRRVYEITLYSVYNGLAWANSALSHRKQPRLWCQPQKLALTTSQVIEMLRRESTEDALIADAPYGMAMLLTLQKVFPCS